MSKSLAEILGTIQDPEAKASLEAQISGFQAKEQRLAGLEAQLQNSEFVDRSIANGWRKFEAEKFQPLSKEAEALRAEVARLRPEAERATALAKQIEGGAAVDPKDLIPTIEKSFEGRFISASDRKAMIDEAVQRATAETKQSVNFGSIPALAGMIEAKMTAKSEFGLDIPIETIGEAVTQHGSIDKAYAALTGTARAAKATKDASDLAAKHASDIEAAKQEGLRLGRQESETRGYSPEEGGGSGVMPMVPPSADNDIVVDPKSYNPADGRLAREAGKLLQQQETSGVWGKQIM